MKVLCVIAFLVLCWASLSSGSSYGFNANVAGTLTVGGNPVQAIAAGSGIGITSNSTFTILSNTDPGSAITLEDGGSAPVHYSLVSTNSAAGQPRTVGLVEGSGISLSSSGQDVTIKGPSFGSGGPSGSITLVSNTSTTSSFQTVGLVAGSGISLSSGGQDVTINGPSFGTGGSGSAGTFTLVSTTSTPTSFQTVGLAPGNGIKITPGQDLTIALSAPSAQTAKLSGSITAQTNTYTTTGVSVTITSSTTTSVLIAISAVLTVNTGGTRQCWVGYNIGTPTNIVPSDTSALTSTTTSITTASVVVVQTLTPSGTTGNTITAYYRGNQTPSTTSCTISNVYLSVVPLN